MAVTPQILEIDTWFKIKIWMILDMVLNQNLDNFRHSGHF